MKYTKSISLCCSLLYVMFLLSGEAIAEREIERRGSMILLKGCESDIELGEMKRKIEQKIIELKTLRQDKIKMYKATHDSTFVTILQAYLNGEMSGVSVDALDIDSLSFLFQLCNSIYVNDDDDDYLKDGAGDLSYEQHRQSLRVKLGALESNLKALNGIFEQISNLSSGSNIEASKKIKEKIKVKADAGGTEPSGAMKSFRDQESAHVVVVQNTMGERYQKLVSAYKGLKYGAKLSDECSLDEFSQDVSEQINIVNNQVSELRRLLAIYDNKNVKIYDTKLRTIMHEKNPVFGGMKTAIVQDVLYRSGEGYLKKGFRKTFAKLKRGNDAVEDSKKQLSGAILKVENSVSDIDFYFVFSGSNSSADWEHNLKIFNKGGGTDSGVLVGLNTHPGFRDSVSESIKEFGTRIQHLHKSIKNLVERNRAVGKKTNISLTFTGHSLGGALALCFAYQFYDLFTNLQADDVSIKFKVYTFGAPGVFDKESAKVVQDKIGASNIIRVFNERDPVANLSFISSRTGKTLLNSLLNYYHIGIPVPISYNVGIDVAQIGEKIDLWAPHLAKAYSNLLVTNKENLQTIFNSMVKDETIRDFRRLCLYEKYLGELLNKISALPDGGGITIDDAAFFNFLVGSVKGEHVIKVEKYKLRPGVKKDKKVSVKISYGGSHGTVVLDRSTSCKSSNIMRALKKQNKDAGANLVKNIQALKKEKEVECKCCLMKKLFVTDDHGVRGKLDIVTGKDNNSLAGIVSQCKEHCDEQTRQVVLPISKGVGDALKDVAKEVGLHDQWEKVVEAVKQ